MDTQLTLRAVFLCTTLLLTLIPACSDTPSSPDDSGAGLDGTVLGPGGMPVEGAAIHVILHTNPETYLQKPSGVNASATISFSVTQMPYVQVTVKILRYGTQELLITPFDAIAAPGRYSIVIDSKQVGNGVFVASINMGGAIAQQLFLLNTDNITLLGECPPVATSDSDGKFSFPYSILGTGTTINQPTPDGGAIPIFITSIVDIVVLKGGFTPIVQRDTVEVTVSESRTFDLSP